MKKLRITVDGKAFDVSVEILDSNAPTSVAPTSAPVAASAPISPAATPAPVAAPVATGGGQVPSPLAGKVVSLDVAVGTAIKEGDQILTLEAMKMNTNIYAPCSGTLTAFNVSPGETVQEGQSLAVIG